MERCYGATAMVWTLNYDKIWMETSVYVTFLQTDEEKEEDHG